MRRGLVAGKVQGARFEVYLAGGQLVEVIEVGRFGRFKVRYYSASDGGFIERWVYRSELGGGFDE